ncbi:MAG: KpsF/GutQ family sugar-phosphate isomerase [Ignavibacteria bacterium]|nr:KpsF/GutQ family sugar-phosphate isomerase [Ignavibacteria bacterium]
MTTTEIIAKGREVIEIEAKAVLHVAETLDASFSRAVELMYQCQGRVVLSGMGKSGLIARKIVATLNSTGTPAIYLHPTDALHGDLGMVRKEDVVILISKSGATEELSSLMQMFKRLEVPVIGMLGDAGCQLAKEVDLLLHVDVSEEACPFDLAPTASTTATLALGDALSVAILHMRGFTEQDFAMLHPGGSLGKRLSLRVSEIMKKGDDLPIVYEDTSLKDTIIEITSKRLGVTCVLDSLGRMMGIITDGDLRRLLERTLDLANLKATEVMTKNPKKISPTALASTALQMMENYKITSIVVAGEDNKPQGIVHLHDLVNIGLKIR